VIERMCGRHNPDGSNKTPCPLVLANGASVRLEAIWEEAI
jgi:hypothetical protein